MAFEKQTIQPAPVHPWQTSAQNRAEVYKETLTAFPTAVGGYHRSSVLDISNWPIGKIEIAIEATGDPAEALRVHVGGIYSLDANEEPDLTAIKNVSNYHDCLVDSRLVFGVQTNAPYIIFLFEEAETDCAGAVITVTAKV